MTTPPTPQDVREIAARVIHRQEHWSMPLVHRTMNPDGVCEGALHIADAVLAAVTPVIRQQALLEAERAIFNDALCNEGTPYDSLLGAIQVVKRLRESAVIARSHSTQPGEETKR